MQVKRYIAVDAYEAMNKVKAELGMDAVILNTRKIRRKGFKGLFLKPFVEIVAAVEEKPAAEKKSPMMAQLTLSSKDDPKLRELEERISLIDKMMKTYMFPGRSGDTLSILYPSAVQQLYKRLLEQDVDETYARLISAQVNKLIMDNNIAVEEAALDVITACFGKSFPISITPGNRKIVIFTGSTGIGKTTTLAKLAAIYTLQHKKRVGLITTDTYRIGAAEQLQVYADLLNIPLKIIYTPEEIHVPLKEYADRDLILIDTSGKSSKDLEHQEDIKRLIAESKADEVFLVISATTSYKSCKAILEGYKSLDNYQLILTKLDEAENLGLLLNARLLFAKPIAYITNGQSVPNDIAIGGPRQLAEMLMNSNTIQGEDL